MTAGRLGAIAAALVLTLVNCFEPLHVDDPVYARLAAHIAEHPLDPYGFELDSRPALTVLAPPVVPYWLALGTTLVGDRPVLWKAWLFPFCLLFVLALRALARRWTPGLDQVIVWMTVLSPTFLPSVNVMLDVPALGLSLTALAIFVRAAERDGRLLAAAAGTIAGVAMQTKYTALVLPALLLAYAMLAGRPGLGVLASSVAMAMFAGWESVMAAAYGESHFLYHVGLRSGPDPVLKRMLRLTLPLIATLGGVAPGLTLFGLGALNASRQVVVAAAAMTALAFLALAIVPDQLAEFVVDGTGQPRLTLNNLVFGTLGVGVCTVVASAAHRLQTETRGERGWLDRRRARPIESFAVVWCGVELAGYFLLSPFPAVRRVFGLVIATTMLVGRLAATNNRFPRQTARVAVAASALAGLLFTGVDLLDARAGRTLVDRAETLVRQRDGVATIWYAACCGTLFYAERAEMSQLIVNRSLLRRGDYLLVPDPRFPHPRICVPRERVTLVETIRVDDVVPLTMMPAYYAGRAPMRHLDGSRAVAELYQVERDFVACAPPE